MKLAETKNNQNEFFDLLPQAIKRLKKNIIEPFFGDNHNGKDNGEKNFRFGLRSSQRKTYQACYIAG